ELRMRAVTSREIGIENPAREAIADSGKGGRILVVEDRKASWERLMTMLGNEHEVEVEADPSEALFRVADGGYDLVVVSLALENAGGRRLCRRVPSPERTRNVPILAIAEAEENARLMRGLEIGINDYLTRPIDKNELMAGVRTQIRRKRYTER